MSVSCSRLARLLEPHGFEPRQSQGFAKSCAFVRSDGNPSLYQQIDVNCVGHKGEAVFADLAISATKHLGLKGLSEIRLLREIAKNQERGWTEVAAVDEARIWEQALIQVAPQRVAEFADQARQALLQRTATARQRAQTYLARLDPRKPIREQIDDFYRRLPSATVAEANRLAVWPGVMQICNAEELYLLSCLAVVDGNGETDIAGTDPLTTDELMWEIQLVADGLLSWAIKGVRVRRRKPEKGCECKSRMR